jgi:hypothetical protein
VIIIPDDISSPEKIDKNVNYEEEAFKNSLFRIVFY